MKKLIALLGLVGTALAGDLVLKTEVNPNRVHFESEPEWKYTLFHSTNLNDWVDLGTTRGNGTNLTFDAAEGFYKAAKNYEPVEPLSANLSYSQTSNCQSFVTTNFSSTPYDVRVNYTEISNPGNLSYTTTSEFVETVFPGENVIGNCLYFEGSSLRKTSALEVYGRLEMTILYRQPESLNNDKKDGETFK